MNGLGWCVGLGCTALFAATAFAQDGAQLSQSKGCMTCHDVSQQKMGPSFKAIAASNKGKADAQARLVGALKSGSGHVKVDATDAELQQIVAYVLATP